jgi:hypothetical protein
MDEMLHLASRAAEGATLNERRLSIAKLLRYAAHLKEADDASAFAGGDCRVALLRTATLLDMCIEDEEPDVIAMLRRIQFRVISGDAESTTNRNAG